MRNDIAEGIRAGVVEIPASSCDERGFGVEAPPEGPELANVSGRPSVKRESSGL